MLHYAAECISPINPTSPISTSIRIKKGIDSIRYLPCRWKLAAMWKREFKTLAPLIKGQQLGLTVLAFFGSHFPEDNSDAIQAVFIVHRFFQFRGKFRPSRISADRFI